MDHMQALDDKLRLGGNARENARKTDAAGVYALRDPRVVSFLKEKMAPVKVGL